MLEATQAGPWVGVKRHASGQNGRSDVIDGVNARVHMNRNMLPQFRNGKVGEANRGLKELPHRPEEVIQC